MKNILLLTDFSENSINAMHYALELFKDDTHNFFILHVELSTAYISDDLILKSNQSIYDSLIKNPKRKLTQIKTDLKTKFKSNKLNFEIIIDHDAFIDAINQAVKSKEIDLIVMGTNGVSGAKEVVFGSNTINVIRKVDCPTLVIPENFKFAPIKEILLPLDVSDSLGGKGFVAILNFTKEFGEKLHLLRINPHQEDSKEALKDNDYIDYFINDATYEYHTVNDGVIEEVVNCYIQTHQIDLIALLVRKETVFERFFMGSSTTKINKKIKAPLLIFHY